MRSSSLHLRALRVLAPLALIAAVGACSGSTTGTTTARTDVRVVQASPDAPPLDVLVDDTVDFTGLPFDSVTPYALVRADSDTVSVRASGGSSTLTSKVYEIAAGQNYTLVPYGPVAALGTQVLVDDTVAPASGSANVRAFLVAPSMGAVDVYVSPPGTDLTAQSPLMTGLRYPNASANIGVIAGTYDVRVTLTGTKTVVLDAGTITFGDGQNRTLVLLDHAGIGLPIGSVLLSDRD